MAIKSTLKTHNLDKLSNPTGNLYESLVIMGKRARQISSKTKEELSTKLTEFASNIDNLEEVFENREQIEISKFYERMPKPSTLAIDDFTEDRLNWRERGDE